MDAMMRRCSLPSKDSYPRYGGRGIRVCERWHDFANFLEDMGERPSRDHCLSRLDHDDDYRPGNVEWALITDNCRDARMRQLEAA